MTIGKMMKEGDGEKMPERLTCTAGLYACNSARTLYYGIINNAFVFPGNDVVIAFTISQPVTHFIWQIHEVR